MERATVYYTRSTKPYSKFLDITPFDNSGDLKKMSLENREVINTKNEIKDSYLNGIIYLQHQLISFGFSVATDYQT